MLVFGRWEGGKYLHRCYLSCTQPYPSAVDSFAAFHSPTSTCTAACSACPSAFRRLTSATCARGLSAAWEQFDPPALSLRPPARAVRKRKTCCFCKCFCRLGSVDAPMSRAVRISSGFVYLPFPANHLHHSTLSPTSILVSISFSGLSSPSSHPLFSGRENILKRVWTRRFVSSMRYLCLMYCNLDILFLHTRGGRPRKREVWVHLPSWKHVSPILWLEAHFFFFGYFGYATPPGVLWPAFIF